MIEPGKYISVFASCILCKGAKRSMLYDPQRNDYELLPNEMYDILIHQSRKYTVGELAARLNKKDRPVFMEYLAFLIEKEYIFSCTSEELSSFPPIDEEWEWPGEITNAIIDIRSDSTHDFRKIFSELDALGCEHLQIRCYDPLPISYFKKWLPLLNDTCIFNVELLICFTKQASATEAFYTPLLQFARISSLVVHGAPANKKAALKSDQRLSFIKQQIDGEHHCGLIGEKYFSLTLPHILESRSKNTCLHKKISIDSAGHIRNCPSLPDSYGHISSTSLSQVLKKGKLQKLWTIHKDQVEVCRDCEFRMVCTDCRAYRKDEKDIFSKPAKCNYDPYTNTWQNSGH